MELPRPPAIYSIDTSSLIAFTKRFPTLDFLGGWDRLAALARQGRLIAPQPVRREAERMSRDVLTRWIASCPEMFIDEDALWDTATEVTRNWNRLIDADEPNEDADPWVIALAIVRNREAGFFGPECIVVSEEVRRPVLGTVSRIPEVCDALQILHCDHIEFSAREGWSI